MSIIEVDENGAAQPHPASPGDNVVIRLPESPSSGHRWQLDAYDPAVLTPDGDAFVVSADAMTGGGGRREFRFVVESAARSDVVLSLRRAWETEVAAAQRFQTAIN